MRARTAFFAVLGPKTSDHVVSGVVVAESIANGRQKRFASRTAPSAVPLVCEHGLISVTSAPTLKSALSSSVSRNTQNIARFKSAQFTLRRFHRANQALVSTILSTCPMPLYQTGVSALMLNLEFGYPLMLRG